MDETNTNIELEKGAEVEKGSPVMAVIAAAAGWLVPGLGHLLLRRWAKALAYFVAVGMLAVVGLLAHGAVFSYGSKDALDKLGFFADVGNGLFYFFARTIDSTGPDVSHASGDYGTRLFATAGVLNFLCVLEAVHIALRRGSERPAG